MDELVQYGQKFDFKIRRDNRKNSYESRVYESVDVRNFSYIISRKSEFGTCMYTVNEI